MNFIKPREVAVKKQQLGLTALAAITVSALAWGWGLVVPNGSQEGGEESNQYYQKEEMDLVRFDCPDGTVPTSKSCKDNRTSLGKYQMVIDSLTFDLSTNISKLAAGISAETSRLKEADPKTKTLRASVAQYNLDLADKKAEEGVLTAKRNKAQSNLDLIKDELETIEAALKNNPSQEELTRLLKEKKVNQDLKIRYNAEKVAFEKGLAKNKTEQEDLAALIDAKNNELAAFLKALEVSSEELESMIAKKGLLEQEEALVPEMEARLKEKVAYHLASWEEPGAPELFARLLKHITHCQKHGQGWHQGQNPVQQNPVQQQKPVQQQSPVQQTPVQQQKPRRP